MKEENVEKGIKPFPHLQLSPRQVEILKLMCRDNTNAEIAEAIGLSIRTVETVKTQILKNAGAKNMASVINWAVREGLI